MPSSTEAHIVARASDGDPPYADWARRQTEEGGRVLPSMRDVLIKLTEGGFFTDVELAQVGPRTDVWSAYTCLRIPSPAQVSSYLHENPIPGFTPTQVGHGWSVPAMMITSRNSPVTAMFNRGLQRLRQTGLGELMMLRYILR